MDLDLERRLSTALPPHHRGAEVLVRTVELLAAADAVSSIWFTGSLATGTADRHSDIDLLVVTTDEERLGGIAEALTTALEPVIRTDQDFGPSVLLTMVLPDWTRVDVNLLRPGQKLPGRADRMVAVLERGLEPPQFSGGEPRHRAVPDQVTEIIRVLGLAPVVLGRQNLLTAVAGCGLLVTLLSTLGATLTGAPADRGAMAAESGLDPAVRHVLADLPVIRQDVDDLVDFHRAAVVALLALLELSPGPELPAHFVRLWDALTARYRASFDVALPALPASVLQP